MLLVKKIFPVLLLQFVNMLGFSILIPVLPFIVRSYGVSDLFYGLLLSSYSLFQFVATPLIGKLSDVYGRKPLLIITQAGTLASWGVFALGYFLETQLTTLSLIPLFVIMLARVVDGITGGNMSVASAYLADVTTQKERTSAFALVGAAIGSALVIGPSIGSLGYTQRFTYLGTALVAALISTVTLISIIFFLKESLPQKDRARSVSVLEALSQLNVIGRIAEFTDLKLRKLFAVRTLFSLVMSGYTSIIALYIIDAFELTQNQLGFFLLFVGMFLIVNQLLAVKVFVAKLGDSKTLTLGALLLAVGIFSITFAQSLAVFTLLYYIANLGLSLIIPTIQSLITQAAKSKQRGAVLGIDSSLAALMSGIVPVLSGVLYTTLAGQTFWIYALVSLSIIFIVPVTSKKASAKRR